MLVKDHTVICLSSLRTITDLITLNLSFTDTYNYNSPIILLFSLQASWGIASLITITITSY